MFATLRIYKLAMWHVPQPLAACISNHFAQHHQTDPVAFLTTGDLRVLGDNAVGGDNCLGQFAFTRGVHDGVAAFCAATIVHDRQIRQSPLLLLRVAHPL